ncbi:MAG: ADP-ribosylglycohydrolase family protein [Ardenticatenaceae bacterium]|nr:ADP-ribosylglycohydrolase family protein [Ardenticatenaceae bacterium]
MSRHSPPLILGALHAIQTTLLSPLYTLFSDQWQTHPLMPDIAAIANGSFKENSPDIKVLHVGPLLKQQIWRVFTTKDSFREGCFAAANLGHDADTTAPLFGQIAGALLGESGIPQNGASE